MGVAVAFINPLVSILPRVLFVLFAVLIFYVLKKLLEKWKHGDIFTFGLVSLISVIGIFYGSNAVADFSGWDRPVLNFIALILSALVITFYFAFIRKMDKSRILYPSVLLLSTVVHTFLVLFAILIFSKDILVDLFQTEEIVGILVSIAVTNGLVEALLAAVIGTPIIYALKQIQER